MPHAEWPRLSRAIDDASRENIERLLSETLPFENRAVPLRDLVSYEIVRGPREIRRENQQREGITAHAHHALLVAEPQALVKGGSGGGGERRRGGRC